MKLGVDQLIFDCAIPEGFTMMMTNKGLESARER